MKYVIKDITITQNSYCIDMDLNTGSLRQAKKFTQKEIDKLRDNERCLKKTCCRELIPIDDEKIEVYKPAKRSMSI